MEGYLEIFGKKFCEKEISGYGEGNYLLRSENTESLFQSSPCYNMYYARIVQSSWGLTTKFN